ncbi:hypothetical protein LTR05_003625 [Lithohypha guttulata]|uniref:U6 small nuclear RNA (adenine-(43)-N(6))-methyltransferase n=1 Tax=Lithohypha guttulata TaxID=1690604 RepID=A0AAN7T202_9EURO|nr:hypothetical protein LTR05_003625 [Lithohypha guttulata]
MAYNSVDSNRTVSWTSVTPNPSGAQQDNYSNSYDPQRKVIGLDIGTGASSIYPLLACRQRPEWRFLATEIDSLSRDFANQNIISNGMDRRIKLLGSDPGSQNIIPSTQLERFDRIDILLTNPPFYTSEAELQSLAKQKARPPNSACTGAPVEMICPGGEVTFVGRIVQESRLPENRVRIQWFSSMLGKLSSVTAIIDKLHEIDCTNYAVTEFVQGQKTRRWCVAWSWTTLRPSLSVARGTDVVEKKYLPFPTELELSLSIDLPDTIQKINVEIPKLQGMEWQWRQNLQAGIGRSMIGDVWSRHARRKQKKLAVDDRVKPFVEPSIESKDNADNTDGEDDIEPKFVFKITFKQALTAQSSDDTTPSTTLVLRWLQGDDSTLFESFHGWLKRKLV